MSVGKIDKNIFKQCYELYDKLPKEFFERNCLYNAYISKKCELLGEMVDSGLFEDEYENELFGEHNLLQCCIEDEINNVAIELIKSGKCNLNSEINYLNMAILCDNFCIFKELLKYDSGQNNLIYDENKNRYVYILYYLINDNKKEYLQEFVNHANIQKQYDYLISHNINVFEDVSEEMKNELIDILKPNVKQFRSNDCIEDMQKTVLELMKENERQKKIIDEFKKNFRELRSITSKNS